MAKISENMTVEETLRIALEAHEGQKDLDGKPVVLHPIAVGLMGCNDAETKMMLRPRLVFCMMRWRIRS